MTNEPTSRSAGAAPDALLEEAVIWHARLRDPAGPAAAARRAAFQDWIDADPRHRAAYDEAEWLWQAVAAPIPAVGGVGVGAAPASARSRTRTAARRLALAAGVAMMLGAGWAWQATLLDRLRADHATGVGERASVTLADGSVLVLASDTAVDVDFDAPDRRVHLLRGEAWFEVSPDRDRPFVVATDAGSVRVTGTRFDVRIDGDDAVVSLEEGRVEVQGAAGAPGAPVALAPGEQARLTPAGVGEIRPYDATVVNAWRRGQFVFYQAPLADVVATLNRYRPGRIVVLGDRLKRLRVSGVFKTDDPDAVIAAIEETLPVRASRLTDYLVLLR